MSLLIVLTVFTLLVVAGTILSNTFPRIPAALFQIILGAVLVLLPVQLPYEFDPEAFLLLIVAPLLFTDAYNISRVDFWVYRKPIFIMAVGLVIFSTIIVGSIIYALIPAMPWATSFALAAIISPTDAVAVKAIIRGAKLPKGLMPILEGESLLNDAVGLVSFNVALGVILTNTFSAVKVANDFIIIALGGAVLGLVFSIILVFLKKFLDIIIGDEANGLVIFQIMTPIVVYYISNELGVSGIVAVVVTGLVYNLEKDLYQYNSLNSKTSLLIDSTQDTFGYILNGFVFVLLGYILPGVFIDIMVRPELNVWLISLYIFFITLALMAVRFIYVYVFYNRFHPYNHISQKRIIKIFIQRKLDVGNYSRARYSALASLCGIHGTITMAACLLIPTFLSTGEPFPLRNTILYLASGVVLLSILIGIIFIPLLIQEEDQDDFLEMKSIRQRIINQAIIKLKKHYEDGSDVKRQIATALVIKDLQAQQVMVTKNPGYLQAKVHKIHREVIKAENKQIKAWEDEHNLSKATINVIKLMQLRRAKLLNYSVINQMILLVMISYKENYFKRLRTKTTLQKTFLNAKTEDNEQRFVMELEAIKKQMVEIQPRITEIALETINKIRTPKNSLSAEIVSDVYKHFSTTHFTVFVLDESYEEDLKELKAEAIKIQKDKVIYLKKSNQISIEDSNTILKELNYNESLIF